MKKLCKKEVLAFSVLPLLGLSTNAEEQNTLPFLILDDDTFYQQVMKGKPYLPSDSEHRYVILKTESKKLPKNFISSNNINYKQENWQGRIGNNWLGLNVDEDLGKAVVIESMRHKGQLHYRYSTTQYTHKHMLEPWSSSKIFPITAAMSLAKSNGISGDFNIGQYKFSDLITSVHSYDKNDAAAGDSNAIASYLANQVGRKTLTNYFHQDWLLLKPQKIAFRGAYGINALQLKSNIWQKESYQYLPSGVSKSNQDKYYQTYRCEDCGLTGNKPMTLLALAEWLKRLAVAEHDVSTQFKDLTTEDLQLLFYGSNDKEQPQGMMAGVSKMLANAIALNMRNLSQEQLLDETSVPAVLNEETQGQWRIFQKIGWGYSGTRTAGEMVYLAHVILPNYKGGKSFTIAAQAQAPGKDEIKLYQAGRQMQRILDTVVKRVIVE